MQHVPMCGLPSQNQSAKKISKAFVSVYSQKKKKKNNNPVAVTVEFIVFTFLLSCVTIITKKKTTMHTKTIMLCSMKSFRDLTGIARDQNAHRAIGEGRRGTSLAE